MTKGGDSILDSNLRKRLGIVVLVIRREGRRMDFNPEPGALIRSGAMRAVRGRPDSVKRLDEETGP